MFLRNAAKAIIVRDGRLLTIEKSDEQGTYVILPGGGQEPGEDLAATVRRECREEVGVDVEVGDLRFVRDYVCRNHEFADENPDLHQVEFYFLCALAPEAVPVQGHAPDEGQIGLSWHSLERLPDRLYPRALRTALTSTGASVYLGDVN